MTQQLVMHPENPQRRLLRQVAKAIQQGAIVAYPTDSAYALGCALGNREGLERIRRIRQVDKQHNFTLVCRDLSELSSYAMVDNSQFRMLKAVTPGPYTFILAATKNVPKRLLHAKRKTIGIRLPAHVVTQALLEELDSPLMSVTLILPQASMPLADPSEIYAQLKQKIDLLLDAGPCQLEPTTVIDWSEKGSPRVLRQGLGSLAPFDY